MIEAKRDRLLSILGDLPGAVVAFSGGVDSAVVAKAAAVALGTKAVAVTADSPSVPRAELAAAAELAATIGIRHVVLSTNEFENPNYLANAGDRCYFCKSELYDRVRLAFPDLPILSGANLDDRGDYRPGLTAAAERGIRHPLQEAMFTKADVRELAKAWGLPVWDKPASPCLSSRIAPGVEATRERTHRVELAEAYLKERGVTDCRVRVHAGELARVELPSDELSRFLQSWERDALDAELKRLGFTFVTVDLAGLSSGSLNTLIPLGIKARYTSSPVSP